MYWEDGAQVLAALAWPAPSSTQASPRSACRLKPLSSSCWSCRWPCCSGTETSKLAAVAMNVSICRSSVSQIVQMTSSFASYFLLLVTPAAFPQWSSAVPGAACVYSEERRQLLDGSTEGEEEEREQRTSGRYCWIQLSAASCIEEDQNKRKASQKWSKICRHAALELI